MSSLLLFCAHLTLLILLILNKHFSSCLAAKNNNKHDKNNGNGNLAISDVNVLLPYRSSRTGNSQTGVSNAIHYKITAEGGESNGCVEWSVDDDSIVTIQLFDNLNCPKGTSKALIIRAISTVEQRVSTQIHAKDLKSFETAECNIFVDEIARLEVLTSTRLIYKTQYESIRVIGFDSNNNRFATVEGYV